MKKVEKT